MNIFDNDLISIQEARILAERASEAKKLLSEFSQDKLDKIVIHMLDGISSHIKELAFHSFRETGYGNVPDKIAKNRFIIEYTRKKISDMKCVGFIEEDKEAATMKIGVPMGLILSFVPATSPVSTTIFNVLIAIKSGNAIIVSPHPRAEKTIKKILDLLINLGLEAGLPEGALSYLSTLSVSGSVELIHHDEVNFIINTAVPNFLEDIKNSSKGYIYSGTGNGPCFIERTADIKQAVSSIIESKTFDNGIVSAAENALIVERCIEEETKKELERNGSYFMTEEEADKLASILYLANGCINPESVGLSAPRLAKRAGFVVDESTKLLIANGKYNLSDNLYSKEKLFPVLTYYIEDDWRNACEKCIELLLFRNGGHTLVIHSNDDYVIRQFALKKPVARVLVNTPASLGGLGITTNLYPSMILGSGKSFEGSITDNISPMNLVFVRSLGFGVRDVSHIRRDEDYHFTLNESNDVDKLQELLKEAIKLASQK